MWQQYKRNFLGIQAMSCGVAAWVYFGLTHNWAASTWIFLTMQVGGVLGAAWATRLKRKILQGRMAAGR
jgi:NAD/NADP transhydrogenase beta subunit